MYSDRRTSQGGSVAVFLIVSVVLAAAVIGGVYFVHQRGDQVRSVQPIAHQPNKTDQQPDQQKQQSDDEAKKQEEARKQAEATKQAEEAKKKADQEAKQRQEQAAKEKEQAEKQRIAQNNAQTNVPQTGPSASTAQPNAGTNHLPTTGPEDTLPQLVAAGVLIAIVAAYLRSYRHRFGSLLR